MPFDKLLSDMLDNNKLLKNCVDIGVRAPLVAWLASYTFINECRFPNMKERYRNLEVSGGVPQGDKLCPVIFAIIINKLPSVVHCG